MICCFLWVFWFLIFDFCPPCRWRFQIVSPFQVISCVFIGFPPIFPPDTRGDADIESYSSSGSVHICGVDVEFPRYGIHEAKGIEPFGRAGPHTAEVTMEEGGALVLPVRE